MTEKTIWSATSGILASMLWLHPAGSPGWYWTVFLWVITFIRSFID
jgi:uncharacterized membrane protein HdeD (DUF308 family)